MSHLDPTAYLAADPQQRLQLLARLAENAPDGIAVLNTEGIITYANPALRTMLGYEHDIIGMHATEVVANPPQEINQLIQRVVDQGDWREVLTYLRRDGSTFHGQVSALRITDEQGRIWALAGIVRDISEHLEMKAALEVALSQSQHVLQEFLDHMPGIVYVYDLQHRCQLVNRQFLEFWECAAEDVLGRLDSEHLPPDQLDEWYAVEQQILASGRPVSSEDRRHDKHQHRVFLSTKFPLYNPQGQIYAIGGISTEITERIQIEDALRASTERLRLFEALVEHAPDAISVLTLNGQLDYANPSYHTKYPFSAEFQQLHIADLYDEAPERLTDILQQAGAEGFWSGVLTHRGHDRHSFPARVTAFAIRNHAGQPTAIATFVRDISDQVRQEQERMALQAHVVEVQRATVRNLSVSLAQPLPAALPLAFPAAEHEAPLLQRIKLSEQLLAYAHQQVLMGREQEQRRIARELHDGAIQQLLGISYRLVEIRQSLNDLAPVANDRSEALNSALEATRWQMLNLVGQLRRLVSELRPAGLEELGLVAPLRSYVEQLQREGGAALPAIDLHLNDIALPESHTLCLFRVAQEALRNAIHHAQANRIEVVLQHDATAVTLRIADDGCGFVLPPQLSELISANHFGLVGMTERVAWVGGQLQIKTAPGQGTAIMVRLPLNERNGDE